jgi:RHS repeat-associated protein
MFQRRAEVNSKSVKLHPFGSCISNRGFSSAAYRFGFNGKEKDHETFEGSLGFEARIFDSRLGKFLSLDPRMGEYAWQTPYAYYKNNPITILDIAGMGGPLPEGGNTSQGCTTTESPSASISGSQGAVSDGSTAAQCNSATPPQLVTEAPISNCETFLIVQNASPNTSFACPPITNENGSPEEPSRAYSADFIGPLPENSIRENENTQASIFENTGPRPKIIIGVPTSPFEINLSKVGDAYYTNVYYDETYYCNLTLTRVTASFHIMVSIKDEKGMKLSMFTAKTLIATAINGGRSTTFSNVCEGTWHDSKTIFLADTEAWLILSFKTAVIKNHHVPGAAVTNLDYL